MRASLLIAAALMAAASATAATPDAKTRIEWDAPSHDFGTFNEDLGPVTHVFKGVNMGPDTVSVTQLSATCGCTTPVTDKDVIAPGDTVRLTVTYDPSNRPGAFNKRVYFNAHPSCSARFTIKGNVIGSHKLMKARFPHEVGAGYRVSDCNVAFGNIRNDKGVSSRIRGINSSEESITPVVTRKPDYITAHVDPTPVAPGSNFTMTITAEGPRIPLLGLVTDSITVSSAERPGESLTMPVSMIVFEDFGTLTAAELDSAARISFPQPDIDLGDDIDPASAKPIKRSVKVTNAGMKPLFVRRAYTMGRGVEIKAPEGPIAPGKSADIDVTVTPAALGIASGGFDIRISVISNTPLEPVTEIAVRGIMKEQ